MPAVRIAVVQSRHRRAAQGDDPARGAATVAHRALRIAEGRLDVADSPACSAAEVRRGPIAAARVSGVLRLETGIGDIDVARRASRPTG